MGAWTHEWSLGIQIASVCQARVLEGQALHAAHIVTTSIPMLLLAIPHSIASWLRAVLVRTVTHQLPGFHLPLLTQFMLA